MRKRIRKNFLYFTIIIVLLTAITSIILSYNSLKSQVFSDLEVIYDLIDYNSIEEIMTRDIKLDNGYRITIISEDGVVIYDSVLDASSLENHFDREEVQESLNGEVGKAIRQSDSISKQTFYYAKKYDGYVLRISKNTDSLMTLMQETIYITIFWCVIIIIVSYFISNNIIKRIVSPIKRLSQNMTSEEYAEDNYEEITPFMEKIRFQHLEILRQNKMREEFTANVSHELKTPLTAIRGYADLMANGIATEKDTKNFSRKILFYSDRLGSLINDILELSKLDSKEYIEKKLISLQDLVKDSLDNYQNYAAKNQIKLLDDLQDAKILANESLIRELIDNLLSNAIKYNKPGGYVKIKVSKAAEGVNLIVEDNGVGISKENQERIFERFYRVDKSRSRELGGTGLGLAIVKHIVSLHGAKIKVDSTLQVGTTIKIQF